MILWANEQVVKERKLAERKAQARAGSRGGGGGGKRGSDEGPSRRNMGGVSSKKGLAPTPLATGGRASLGVKGAGVMKGAHTPPFVPPPTPILQSAYDDTIYDFMF